MMFPLVRVVCCSLEEHVGVSDGVGCYRTRALRPRVEARGSPNGRGHHTRSAVAYPPAAFGGAPWSWTHVVHVHVMWARHVRVQQWRRAMAAAGQAEWVHFQRPESQQIAMAITLAAPSQRSISDSARLSSHVAGQPRETWCQ